MDLESPATNSPLYPYNTKAEPDNPTVIPKHLLEEFQFIFLIRHPRSTIPSHCQCTVPPFDKVIGFYSFLPSEAGYDKLHRVFDYLKSVRQISPKIAGRSDSDLRLNDTRRRENLDYSHP
jgi:hypothetical protein